MDALKKITPHVCLIQRRWKKNLPIYLSLLVDDAMGFFSSYPAMKPQLGYVDDCRRKFKRRFKNTFQNWSILFELGKVLISLFFCFLVCFQLPEFNEEWWRGLWEPNMFIR